MPLRVSRIVSYKYFPIIILIGINLVIGAFVVTDYGESWDEFLRYRYAENSIAAYSGVKGDIKDEKGPLFVMLAVIGGKLLHPLRQDWLVVDARHLINFWSFQFALLFLYRLCYRFTNKWAAFGAALLFNTQPLLWGHAFINPKDIPFMAFFLASVDVGLEMADSFGSLSKTNNSAVKNNQARISLQSVFFDEWSLVPGKTRRRIIGLVVIFAILFLVLTAGYSIVRELVGNLIYQAYAANPDEILGLIFTRIAENATDISVDAYVQKAWNLYPRIVVMVILFIFFGINLYARRSLPKTEQHLWRSTVLPALKQIYGSLANKKVLVAGIFLGMASSIRTLGPASGLLVAMYFLVKARRRALPILVAYFALGAFVTYITWPGLWGAPVKSYLSSFFKASDFPWEGKVMFAGIDHGVGELPRSYLPTLFSIQFTLTAMVTIVVGFVVAIIKTVDKTLSWEIATLLILWFFAPVTAALILQPTIYDNFRQFLFTIPPLFIFAAIGLKSLYDRIHRPEIYSIIVLLLVLPNIYWLAKLHPYQYVYYNPLVGGVRGAFREYEMDYWATSYKEATEFINRTSPLNSKVIVWGAIHPVETYARPDLIISEYRKSMELDGSSPVFVIVSSRHDKDISLFPSARQLYVVGNDGATFAVVKELDQADISSP